VDIMQAAEAAGVEDVAGDVADVPSLRLQTTCARLETHLLCPHHSVVVAHQYPRSKPVILIFLTFTKGTTIGMFASAAVLILRTATRPKRAPLRRPITKYLLYERMPSNSSQRDTTRAPKGCTKRSCPHSASLDGVGRSVCQSQINLKI